MSTQAFPVIPSASSGGGASGVVWIDIENLSSGWTFSDPDARLTSYAYNSGTKNHSFTLVSMGSNPSGWVDYSTSTTAGTYKAPRWSRTLVDENGVALTSDDEFLLLIRHEDCTFGTNLGWSVAVVYSRDTTSTTRATGAWTGTSVGITGIGQPTATAIFAGSNTNQIGLTGGTKAVGTAQMCGSGRNKNVGSAVTMFSSNNANATARQGQLTLSASTPLYLEVMCPTQGTVTTATAGTLSMKLKYAIVRTA